MAQQTFMSFMNNVLKEKNLETAILGGFYCNMFKAGEGGMLNADPLLKLFVSLAGDAIEPFRAIGKVNNNGSEYWVPVKTQEAVDAYAPISDLNADSAITAEDNPDYDVFKYPTERHWGLRGKLFAKDERLFEDKTAVGGVKAGGPLVTRKVQDLFGMFRSFALYFANRLYLAQSDPLIAIDKTYTPETVTRNSVKYWKLKLKQMSYSPTIPSYRIQDGMSLDFYDDNDDTAITNAQSIKCFIIGVPAGESDEGYWIEIQDTALIDIDAIKTAIVAATGNPIAFKAGAKGLDFKGWGDFVVNTGTLMNFDMSRFYKMQPIKIDRGSSGALKLNASTSTETDQLVWRPIEQVVLEYEAKHGIKPDFLIISTKQEQYLRRDALLRGLTNTPLEFNVSKHEMSLGATVLSYAGVPLVTSPLQAISKIFAIKAKNYDLKKSNFEFVTYGKQEIVPDVDQSGNIFLKDQVNTYSVAKWYTLFDTVMWPMDLAEVTGITYV